LKFYGNEHFWVENKKQKWSLGGTEHFPAYRENKIVCGKVNLLAVISDVSIYAENFKNISIREYISENLIFHIFYVYQILPFLVQIIDVMALSRLCGDFKRYLETSML